MSTHGPATVETELTSIAGADVSVIIPAYGDCPHLEVVVDSLLDQIVKPGEIIIVHSGPANPASGLESRDARIKVCHFPKRLYAAAARNHGLEKANGRWAAFLDADVRPVRGWLADLLKTMAQGPRRFVIGSIGFAETGGYWGLCLWSIEFSQYHPDLPQRTIKGGASANLLAAMEDLQSAGGFPEWMAASEDALLCASLHRIGLISWFCPGARVDHFNISGFHHFRRHLISYGMWSAISRKIMPLKGRITIRIWPLAFFLWLLRFSIICGRALAGGAGNRMRFLVLLPGIFFGLLIWNAGYIKGIFAKTDDHQTSD